MAAAAEVRCAGWLRDRPTPLRACQPPAKEGLPGIHPLHPSQLSPWPPALPKSAAASSQ